MSSEIARERLKPVHLPSRDVGSVVSLALSDPRLEPFVLRHSRGLIFHHPAYLRALEEESGQKCLVLASENKFGQLQAILPLFATRGFSFNWGLHQTGRRLCSLPRTPVGGPLSHDSAGLEAVLKEAIRRIKSDSDLQLQIKTDQIIPETDRLELVRENWRPTFVLDLPDFGHWMQFGDARTRHNLRWAYNKASKLGVTAREAVNEADLREWYKLYLHSMRRNTVPPRSYRFFLSLWRQLGASGFMRVLLAEIKVENRTRMIAGSIFLFSGKVVVYAFTGCLKEYAGTHANDLILYEAIQAAWHRGYRHVDFGEVAEDHPELARFKRKWGAEPRPLYRYYYRGPHSTNGLHRNRFTTLAKFVWRIIPLSVTSWLGERIYSYL